MASDRRGTRSSDANSTNNWKTQAARKVWARFSEIFGKRFLEEFGEEPSSTWREELGNLNEAQLRHGFVRVMRSGLMHPPPLSAFLALCRGNIDNSPVRVLEDNRFTPAERFANQLLVDWILWRMRSGYSKIEEPLARSIYAAAKEVAAQMTVLRVDADPDATTERFVRSVCEQAISLASESQAQEYLQRMRTKIRAKEVCT